MKLENHETKETYTASGLVYGLYWGGGSGCYPSINFHSDTYENLMNQINKALEDESIDSGMGFESIKGAFIEILVTTVIEIENIPFKNVESTNDFVGDLTEEEQDFLLECSME